MSNEAAERLMARRLVPDDELGYLHDGQWFAVDLVAERRATVERTLQILAAHGHKVPLEHDGWADGSTWDEHIEQHIRAQK